MVLRKSTPKTLTISAVLAGTLTVGIAGPAAGATTDVAEAVKAAAQATRTFEKAETSANKSADLLKSATAATDKANDQLTDVRLQVLRTEADLERAREALDRISTEVDQAFAIIEELEPDSGIIDAAAKAAEVAAGDTDLPVLDAAADAAKAGLTAVIGPVLSLVKPISDAVSDEVEQTDQQFAAAEAREQMLSQQRTAAIQDHRTASLAWSEATAQLKSAEAALKKARAAERSAVEQEAEASQAAEKAEDAKAKAEAVEKKAKAAERAAAGRAEAAGIESRSAAVSGRVRPGTGPITSDYGMRTHPVTGAYKLHSGTDFGYGDGSAYAAAAGTVTSVAYDGAYGNMVTVDHGGGTETRYAHLSGASVSSGQRVSAGQKVGNIGATGYATGPHLHFEVLIGGDFVNPLGWLGG